MKRLSAQYVHGGGVLEHPASSWAWPTHGLRRPTWIGWQRGWDPREWVCEVWQSAYGHKAQKRTWLFYCGQQPPIEARWAYQKGTHQCGWFDRNKPTLGKRAASETPVGFAEYLVALARHARLSPALSEPAPESR